MKSFRLSLFKFILGIFLFGLALWVNPIEGYCAGNNYYNIGSFSGDTPYSIEAFSGSFNLADNQPITQYGIVPFSSFDVSLSLDVFSRYNNRSDVSFSSNFFYNISLLFTGYDGGAYSQPLGTIYQDVFLTFLDSHNSLNLSFSTSCEGVPTGIRIVVRNSNGVTTFPSWFRYYSNDVVNNVIDYDFVTSFNNTLVVSSTCSFSNFSFDSSSSTGSSSSIINNISSSLVPIGYSSLNFGLNGSTYFLGSSYIFEPSYLSPLMFSYDFANSVQGVVSSSPLTLAMGGYDSPPNTAHASPIAVIGDTRAGEYELTIALCLSNSPTSAQLSALTNLSNWGFEFNRGYSGQQFGMPSNSRVSYTNFTDSKTGYVYTSVYFYFTTPDYFDSFLIRKAPSLSGIRVGAFAFNKYTGTISDQLNQSAAQWTYDNPSHSSFSSANSSAASTVSAFNSIESDAFSNLDTAMSGAGVNDFNINVISTPLATVSAMINQAKYYKSDLS